MIVLKIIDNLMGEGIPLLEYIMSCAIIIVAISGLYFLLAIILSHCISCLTPKYYSNHYLISEKCIYEDRVCCANLAVDSMKSDYNFSLNSEIASSYNLYSEEQVLEIERNFKNGEIWIFSYDLTTEVLNDKASNVVKRNINKNDVVYREFYIDDFDTFGNAKTNREKMEKWYGENNNLFFYPYKDPDSMLNYLFALFGIVLYIKKSDSNAKVDAYFSLRSIDSRVKKPIYVKMPYCMTNNYYRILRQISNELNERK